MDGDGCSFDCQLEPNACPDDMVAVPADPELGAHQAFCMDRYEASRSVLTTPIGPPCLRVSDAAKVLIEAAAPFKC
jgi:hypothetical protein